MNKVNVRAIVILKLCPLRVFVIGELNVCTVLLGVQYHIPFMDYQTILIEKSQTNTKECSSVES